MPRLLLLQRKKVQRRKRKNNPFSIFDVGFAIGAAPVEIRAILPLGVDGEHCQRVGVPLDEAPRFRG